ncbi:hypothetical protein AB0J83_03475 [Actinoplanes sp. NPDC049596]|uniref:hypothetical protein n=1 Tax=unclassified Actinoplanes TaxID=2626549 RepID=UPI003443EEC8
MPTRAPETGGITADTTDDELAIIATEWEEAASHEVDGVTYYLFGAWDYLNNLRDEAIAEASA